MLTPGTPVPAITVKDQDGNDFSFSSLAGKKIALYFYPKDDTPGCTTQACNLRDNYQSLLDKGIQVIGVSVDNEKKHQKFITKHELPFPLLADTDHLLVNAFGVWVEKSMYGKKYMGTARTTFLIDESGTIAHVIEKAEVGKHAAQILKTWGL